MKINSQISAIVTGGASGLGAGVVSHLANEGVEVSILDMDEEAGSLLARQNGIHFIKTDVTDEKAVSEALRIAREQFGQERICVNCAGIAPSMKTVSRHLPHDAELFVKTIAVNLVGSFHVASQSAAGMARLDPVNEDGERGVIINTASVAAYDGQIGQIAYSASKAGVAGMTLPMARDLSAKGIRVMAIAPGIFGTPMLKAFPQDIQEALAAQIPFPSRLGRADEFAALVAHIIDNPMLNGEVIRLDGAIRMSPR